MKTENSVSKISEWYIPSKYTLEKIRKQENLLKRNHVISIHAAAKKENLY